MRTKQQQAHITSALVYLYISLLQQQKILVLTAPAYQTYLPFFCRLEVPVHDMCLERLPKKGQEQTGDPVSLDSEPSATNTHFRTKAQGKSHGL